MKVCSVLLEARRWSAVISGTGRLRSGMYWIPRICLTMAFFPPLLASVVYEHKAGDDSGIMGQNADCM